MHTYSFIQLLFSTYHVPRTVMDTEDINMDTLLRKVTAMLGEKMKERERGRGVGGGRRREGGRNRER